VHRSRLKTILIDCNEGSYQKGVAFWSAALGAEAERDDDRYSTLKRDFGGMQLVMQSVKDQSAYHLDIETDDVEAEVARLEKLGAVRKYKVQTWWVMRAPSGHDFCVIRANDVERLARDGNKWDE
jgi:Glyoxalase-like domain